MNCQNQTIQVNLSQQGLNKQARDSGKIPWTSTYFYGSHLYTFTLTLAIGKENKQ